MLILSPILTLLLASLLLLALRFTRRGFKRSWLTAMTGAMLSIAGVFLWKVDFPQHYSLPVWQPATVFRYSPAWLADGLSWPYALSLVVLLAAVIWTSVVRAEADPLSWAGALLLAALGILAVAAENPLTLVLAWTAIDLTELITMLRSTEGESRVEGVIVAFSARLAGTALVLWASTISIASGALLDFSNTPARAGIFLLLAAGLRLGILPLHLPYQQETGIRRGFGTMLRLVSAASSLALLARLPSSAFAGEWTPILMTLLALGALYAGWMWLRASDELTGRPFWVLGMASLSIAAGLRAGPAGSVAWGTALVLGGGALFLYSARQRSLSWLCLLAAAGVSALPFTLSAAGWQSTSHALALFLIPCLPAQALLLAGFVRHSLHPGETSLESQPRWVRATYTFGLALPAATTLLLGVWGWDGARQVGVWWAATAAIGLAAGFFFLARRPQVRGAVAGSGGRWADILRLNWLYRAIWFLFGLLDRISAVATAALEGEGGILWSLLLLVLVLSVVAAGGK